MSICTARQRCALISGPPAGSGRSRRAPDTEPWTRVAARASPAGGFPYGLYCPDGLDGPDQAELARAVRDFTHVSPAAAGSGARARRTLPPRPTDAVASGAR
ncbi:hypothetical protein GCM10023084_66540 [Streptomyces lacrimifluminis]|uniref:Uncharacterized protein n=1 Tax=Streptomyces lacrimifluminis TaxID=1500077 RepID=A0A917LBZ8_9ACTN|nr:hypothetical protein GCM10012282_65270 [Streptomyces lacrimifluminis]